MRDHGATGSDPLHLGDSAAVGAADQESLGALLPILYLRGISTGDFREPLAALLGMVAPNLTPSVISGLKAQ